LRKGPYGLYVQLGEAEGTGKDAVKPKRVGLPKGWSAAELDLDKAVKLLSLPREVGKHPETGQPIKAGIGRFGPYLQHERIYASIPADEDVLTIGINRAVDLIKTKTERAAQAKLRDIGRHPKDDKDIALYKGRFGPYLKHGRTVATLPKDVDPDTLTLDAAVTLIDARAAKAKPAKGKGKKAAAAEGVGETEPAAPKKKAPAKAASKPKTKKAKTVAKASNDDASEAPKGRRKAVGEA
jgi:DNA topoisomerase-1